MNDEVTKEERARQVSESLHGWCEAHGVRLMVVDNTAYAMSDEFLTTGSAKLFTFRSVGYGDSTADDEIVLAL